MPHTKRICWMIAILALIYAPGLASAHPMGNFSVNHYARIQLDSDRVVVRYLIDLAEIPAYQELQQYGLSATPDDPKVVQAIHARGIELGHGLSLVVNGKPVSLHLLSSNVIFPPGAGGLPTMKMGFFYKADYPDSLDRKHVILHYADDNYQGHSGWKEIIAVPGAGTFASTSVPAVDRSQELSNYPTDLLTSPPQALEATLEASLPPAPVAVPLNSADGDSAAKHNVRSIPAAIDHRALASPGAAAPPTTQMHKTPSVPTSSAKAEAVPTTAYPTISLRANQQKTPRSRFTELLTTQQLSPWFFLTAVLIAMGLGGLHALEPGHGKTIVAAYLVGSRGTARHAALLGVIVTVSHTAGVFALGAITLYASHYIVPEQLYPWLGVLSGLTIAVLGVYMLMQRLTGTSTDHSHLPGESHNHWFSSKGGQEKEEQIEKMQPKSKSVTLTQLFTLGITGGIIPCPAALIVLLSAFALHRIALGFLLIVAFSIGLACVLIGFGMSMVYARRYMTRLQVDGPLTRRWLPVASSSFITILGFGVAIQALVTTQINFHFLLHPEWFSKEKIGPLLFVVGLGLILGMRHSTDADHVVAISTIVSRQRSVRSAAVIGSVWGLGHTVTIFIVGSLIILFRIEIPTRVGLSMEFCVAIMLVLLGVLNLTGIMQKITQRYTPLAVVNRDLSPVPGSRSHGNVLSDSIERFGMYQCVRPLVIGLVHGLAGSAAVALLVLSTIHDPIWATAYLLIFGAGTMVGMMCMTTAIAVPLTFAGNRFSNLSRYLGLASGLVSVCFGSVLVYQLGFVAGLFTSHPQWTPQ